MVRTMKPSIRKKRNIKEKKRAVKLRNYAHVKRPKPRVHHLTLSSWAMKTVMPFTKGNQVVILHTFVGVGKTRDESNH